MVSVIKTKSTARWEAHEAFGSLILGGFNIIAT